MTDQRSANAFLRRSRELGRVKPRGPGSYWVDHQTLMSTDLDILADARSLTLWNVKVPPGFFGALPALEFLDLRGGTAVSLAPIALATGLRGLVVNQVRGPTDVNPIGDLVRLEFLQLYGLAHVDRLPDLGRLTDLRRVQLGQMRSLADLAGLLTAAPALEELMLSRTLPIDAEALRPLLAHPTLKAFDWYWEDVPWSRAGPVLELMSAKEKTLGIAPEEWLTRFGRPDAPISPPR